MPQNTHQNIEPSSGPYMNPWAVALLVLSMGPYWLIFTNTTIFLVAEAIYGVLLFVFDDYEMVRNIVHVFFAVVAYVYIYKWTSLKNSPLVAKFGDPASPMGLTLIITSSALVYAIYLWVVSFPLMPGASMIPTIGKTERMTLVKSTVFRPPVERGTIISFHIPAESRDFVSRVVGVSGDRIEMLEGQLYVNGRASDDSTRLALLKAAGCVEKKAVFSNQAFWIRGQAPVKRVVVPLGHVFVLADNRSGAVFDSRFLGPIPIDQIRGVVHPKPSWLASKSKITNCFRETYYRDSFPILDVDR